MKVLIVDSDAKARELLKRALLLGSARCEFGEAATAEEALSACRASRFDLVLLDCQTQGKDCVELLKSLNSPKATHRSAVVIMSDADDEQRALKVLKAGAQDFIIKSEITAGRLRRSILYAQARFHLEKKLQESYLKLKQLAERDTLTGLANRHLFDETLRMVTTNNRRYPQKTALLLIDLDNFKYVNDTFGHDVGDLLLQRVVQRIESCLRGKEIFARLGGDEFAIILTNLSGQHEASRVAQRILHVLAKPFEIASRTFSSGASIGIAMYPDNGGEPENLLKNADIAMYRAKHLGKNQACFFAKEMQEEFILRFEIEQKLRTALDKAAFSVNYQPVYYVQDHRLGGFEVLLNWRTEHGTLSPREFLPVAEESRLIIPIGNWVIEQAVKQQREWETKIGQSFSMSINLSPVQLADQSLLSTLKELFEKYDAKPHLFIFEIAETALEGSSRDVNDRINTLKALGCRVALDDFGVGASSIDHLRSFQFDLVKLDPRFVPGDFSGEKDRALFASVVAMIQSLKLETVVVGLETVQQVQSCYALGVQQVQGHFFARPEPPSFIEENYLVRTVVNLESKL